MRPFLHLFSFNLVQISGLGTSDVVRSLIIVNSRAASRAAQSLLMTLHTSASVLLFAYVNLTDARNLIVLNRYYHRRNGVKYSSHNEGMTILSHWWWYRGQHEAQC